MNTDIIADLARQIETLTAQRKELIAQRSVEAKAELAALPREFDWTVTWNGKFQFSVERKFTAETVKAREAWKAKHAGYASLPDREEGGASYMMIGTHVISQGGLMILKLRDSKDWSRDPVDIGAKGANTLRGGNVPTNLRVDW